MDKKIKHNKKNRKGLQRKNTNRKTRTSMPGGTGRGEIRKMRRKATGRTVVGTLITKGARAVKGAIVKGLTNMGQNYASKRKAKLTKKINALGTGMSAQKRRLIDRKKKY